MPMAMHDQVAARKELAWAKSAHGWDNQELVTGKFEKDQFVARVMDHLADQYDGCKGSDPPTLVIPRVGDKFEGLRHVAPYF